MAVLLFLLAIAGGVLVGALTLENTGAASVTVLDRSFTGFSQGQLLAVVAGLGFVVGVLVVGSLSLRRARRVRRRELRGPNATSPPTWPSWNTRTGACGGAGGSRLVIAAARHGRHATRPGRRRDGLRR